VTFPGKRVLAPILQAVGGALGRCVGAMPQTSRVLRVQAASRSEERSAISDRSRREE